MTDCFSCYDLRVAGVFATNLRFHFFVLNMAISAKKQLCMSSIYHLIYESLWRHCRVILDIKPTDLNEGFENEILQKLRKNNFCDSENTIAKIIGRNLRISFYKNGSIW